MALPTPRKRKDAPMGSTQGRNFKRTKVWDARVIRSQTSDAAYSNGELNVDQFVRAREFEIKALEDGIKKSRKGLSTRAHQELPRELRRRTASHNVKRVPKRLRERAKKEVRLAH
jgi:ribonuclease P/MRP protein subunit POP1